MATSRLLEQALVLDLMSQKAVHCLQSGGAMSVISDSSDMLNLASAMFGRGISTPVTVLTAMQMMGNDFYAFICGNEAKRVFGNTRWCSGDELPKCSFFSKYKLERMFDIAPLYTLRRYTPLYKEFSPMDTYIAVYGGDDPTYANLPVRMTIPPVCLAGRTSSMREAKESFIGAAAGSGYILNKDAIYLWVRTAAAMHEEQAFQVNAAIRYLSVTNANLDFVTSINGMSPGLAADATAVPTGTRAKLSIVLNGNVSLPVGDGNSTSFTIDAGITIRFAAAPPANARIAIIKITGDFFVAPERLNELLSYDYGEDVEHMMELWDRGLTDLLVPALTVLRLGYGNDLNLLNGHVISIIKAAMDDEVENWGARWQENGDISMPSIFILSIYTNVPQGIRTTRANRASVGRVAFNLLAMVSVYLRNRHNNYM